MAVEPGQQAEPALAGKGGVDRSGQLPGARGLVDADIGAEAAHALDHHLPQSVQSLPLGVHPPGSEIGRSAQPHDLVNAFGPGAHAALLVSARNKWHPPGVAPPVQGPGALGAVGRVGAEGEELAAEVVDPGGQLAEGLHGIGMEGHPCGTGHFGDFLDRLDGPRLVVGVHDRNRFPDNVQVPCFVCPAHLGEFE